MEKNIVKINRLLDRKIRDACEQIPPEKRKFMVLGLCLSFVILFSLMIWSSFHSEGVQKVIKIEHITPLDLPQDTLVNKLKKYLHGK